MLCNVHRHHSIPDSGNRHHDDDDDDYDYEDDGEDSGVLAILGLIGMVAGAAVGAAACAEADGIVAVHPKTIGLVVSFPGYREEKVWLIVPKKTPSVHFDLIPIKGENGKSFVFENRDHEREVLDGRVTHRY